MSGGVVPAAVISCVVAIVAETRVRCMCMLFFEVAAGERRAGREAGRPKKSTKKVHLSLLCAK